MTFRLRSSGQKILGDVTFTAKLFFSPVLLHTQRVLIEDMLVSWNIGSSRMSTHCQKVRLDILLNIHISKKILKLYDEYSSLNNTSKQRRTSWMENRVSGNYFFFTLRPRELICAVDIYH